MLETHGQSVQKTHSEQPVSFSNASSIEDKWQNTANLLRHEIGDTAYRNWILPISIRSLKENVLEISVSTRFMKDWVSSHYADRIRAIWSQSFSPLSSVEVIIETKKASAASDETTNKMRDDGSNTMSSIAPIPETHKGPSVNQNTALSDIDAISSPLDPRFTFDNFIVGKSNELAHAAARRVAENPTVPFNPLFLYGGVGLGKTHLMHSIAWSIKQHAPQRKVLYLSAEKFMYQFIKALRFRDTVSFKEQFRSVDVLMIDDVQFISGKESTQEEFFHTFNALVDQNRQVIISADKSPSDLDGIEERLRSRLGWGLVADIHPTSYELRLGILESKAQQMNKNIPEDILAFLAHKISSNVRELEGALNRIVAHSDLIGRPMNIETTQDLLHDLLRANERRVTIEDIQRKVAEHFNVRLSDMHSVRRARSVARPRQVAMYLSKQLTTHSLPEIGRKFGGRDHTTVMHAVRRVEELIQTKLEIAEDVDLLKRALSS